MTDQQLKAYADYLAGMKYKDIAAKYNVSINTVKSWQKRHNWTKECAPEKGAHKSKKGAPSGKTGAPIGNKNAVGHGAPLGNKNATGNRGGHAPPRNTNAVVTGEYQTIWLDMIDDTEKKLINAIDTDPIAQLDEDIRLLTLRERRMLKNLNDLREQDGILETKKEYGLIKTPKIVNLIDEKTGKTERIKTEEREMALVGIEENHKLLIDKILRVEEALTRVQTAKTKAIESKHKIISDNANAAKDTITSEHINFVDDWGKDNA